MIIHTYCYHFQLKEKILNAQKYYWLSDAYKFVFHKPTDFSKFRVGTLGIDKKNFCSSFTKNPQKPQAIITEEHFIDFKLKGKHNKFLIFSLKHIVNFDLFVIEIIFYLIWWRLCNAVNCDTEGCIFNPNLSPKKATHICLTCETYFDGKKDFHQDYIRLAILSEVFKSGTTDPFLLEKHFSVYIQKFKLFFKNSPSIQTELSKCIIDYVLSEKFPVRTWLHTIAGDAENKKDEIKEKYKSHRSDLPKSPFLIASRRWNSWTPSLPREEKKNSEHKGGGYIVSDGDAIVAIDPGYGFLDILHEHHGISVMDLDAIIITHDHPDHASELQNILSLRYVYRKECASLLNIFLNPSSKYLYRRIISYYSELLKGKSPYKILPKVPFIIGGLKFTAINMYHNEIFHYTNKIVKQRVIKEVGKSEALGLRIDIKTAVNDFNIAIPGDTFFPLKCSEIKEISDFFGTPDLASVHIGSIEPFHTHSGDILASKILYKDRGHLGLNGVVNFLNLTKPRVAIISEFGEELDKANMRLAITNLVNDLIIDNCMHIIPSDVKLFIAFCDDNIYFRCKCNKFVPVQKIHYEKNDDDFVDYSFNSGCESELGHIKL